MNEREISIQKIRAKRELFRRSASGNAWDFCKYNDIEFCESRPILRVVADTFQYLVEKENTPESIINLIELSPHVKKFNRNPESACVSLSPRGGKSYIVSMCCAWAIGKYPTESVMRNACTATLYDKFSYDIRRIIISEKFQSVFPEIKLSRDRRNLGGWSVEDARDISYFGAGVGGAIIGFGVTLIAITDDLYTGLTAALSDTVNDKTHTWKDGEHNSRIENFKGKVAPKLDIGTRWRNDDVIGRNIEKDMYDIQIIIPALINGETFCESVKTTAQYLKIKSETDKQIWNSEYMQEPSDNEGCVFPEKELNRFSMKEYNQHNRQCINSAIDTADEGTDFFSHIIGENVGKNVYITDITCTTSPFEVTEPDTIIKINEKNIDNVYIESNSAGRLFSLNITKKCHKSNILPKFNVTNKHTRILMQAGFIKKHFYFRDDYEPGSDYDVFMRWLTRYLREEKANSGKKKDPADNAAQLSYLLRNILAHLYE